MLTKVTNIKSLFNRKNFSYRLPFFYSLLLVISLIVSLSNFIYPISLCPSFFGERVCAPIGAYLALFVSIPGYMVVGGFNTLIGGIVWYASLFLVIGVSFVFYYLVGKAIDKYKLGNAMKRNETLIAIVFVFLFAVFLYLAVQQS